MKDHENVLASAKGKQQELRFDSYSHQEYCIDHIPYYLSGLSRAHYFFPTTFLEIAVYKLVCKHQGQLFPAQRTEHSK